MSENQNMTDTPTTTIIVIAKSLEDGHTHMDQLYRGQAKPPHIIATPRKTSMAAAGLSEKNSVITITPTAAIYLAERDRMEMRRMLMQVEMVIDG